MLDRLEARAALAKWLAERWGAREIVVSKVWKLSGGAIQENWALDVSVRGGAKEGDYPLVLRTDAPSSIALSHSRAEEFALVSAAQAAGVKVPEPYLFCADLSLLQRPFYLMARVDGLALGPKVVKDRTWGGDRRALLEDLGVQLGRIHKITPQTHDFPFLEAAPENSARAALDALRRHLDALGRRFPVLEWGMAWLDRNIPGEQGDVVLSHRDFRTGNLMLNADGLAAILDWEFAGWSDPAEDIGWFSAACWRFSRRDLDGGGLGALEDFLRGYRRETGRGIDPDRLAFWQAYAHLRWAVIALQQGERFLSGAEEAIEPALIGRRAVEMEWDLLTLTPPVDRSDLEALPELRGIDVPTERDLLRIADRTLRDDLIPALPSEKRLAGLMIANALGIVRRSLAEPSGGGGDRALSEGLRAGRVPMGPKLWLRLRDDTERRLTVANPRFLESAKAIPASGGDERPLRSAKGG
ncbi:phosphotransferase [Pelagibius sp. CAU 1746]|uniref:phosphotransferase n=1 Tax=Pelagibius sp. CAU 1746 TaxID=3140370 RepID=UPI00325BC483